MRNQNQINQIKQYITDPYSLGNFLSDTEVAYLINMFEGNARNGRDPAQQKVYKNTGPVTLDLRNYINDIVVSKILQKIKTIIGPYELTAAFFFQTNYPHIIHNDDLFQLPDGMYKAITLPLKFNRTTDSTKIPQLCFFDQFYFHGPSKFFKGSSGVPTYYNKQIYEYNDIDGLLDSNVITHDVYNKYFTHLEPQWLEGLSLHSTLPWLVGSALIFDAVRLHAASDFRTLGIESKLGISIFTRRSSHVVEGAPIGYYQIPGT